jgi:hypothetical protein
MVYQLLTVNRPLPKRLSDCLPDCLPPIDEKIGWQKNHQTAFRQFCLPIFIDEIAAKR